MDSHIEIMTKKILKIGNWINGEEVISSKDDGIEKYNPHSGKLQSIFCNSTEEDVNNAVISAEDSFISWSSLNPVKRGQILSSIVAQMKKNISKLTECVALETGKSLADSHGEVQGAILQGEYFAGEGMRLYGQSLNSGMDGKMSHTVREAHGVAGLIVPANTPIANIAWKVFPALICGNTAVLKSSEDAPNTANLFAKLTKDADLPDGVLNVIHGIGQIAGTALVANPKIKVISFTGSTHVGQIIAVEAAKGLQESL
jgi:aldehyde dehydrogenase (NAD+)